MKNKDFNNVICITREDNSNQIRLFVRRENPDPHLHGREKSDYCVKFVIDIDKVTAITIHNGKVTYIKND